MKKLMTMVAAVGMAFGLFAEVTPIADTGFKTGASFEPDPKFGHDNMSWNGGFVSAYWSTLGDSAVKADSSSFTATCGYPDVFAQERHTQVMQLKTPVDTPAVHKIAALPESIGTGLYFDAMAEMTVFDAEEEVAFPAGAKLAVYLQATDEDATGTNFIVQLGTDAKFECTGADLTPGWHRITIKAIANVFEGYTKSASAFLVFVDGAAVKSADAIIDDGSEAYLTAVAAEYNKYGRLFVIPEMTATTELSEIAFGGQGLLDDIVITATAPNFEVIPSAYSIKWDADKVEVMTIGGVEYAGSVGKANISGTAPATVNVTWTGKGDYAAGSDTVTIASGSGTVDQNAYKLADVKIGDYAYTLTDALTLANATEDALTIKLIKDVTGNVEITKANKTLDLAGFTLTGSVNAESEATIALDNSAEGVAIVNGKYADAGTILKANIKFAYSVNQKWGDCSISATPPTGCKFVKDDEANPQYWEIGDYTLDGEGTEASPWLIKNEKDFAFLRDQLSNSNATYTAATAFYRQDADIDLSTSADWTGIGGGCQTGTKNSAGVPVQAASLNGTYDGNGKTIKSSIINGTEGWKYVGCVFNGLYGAKVKNLTVDIVANADTAKCKGGSAFGSITGGAELTGVTVKGTVNGTHNLGAFACAVQGTLTCVDCTNECAVIRSDDDSDKLGGFFGLINNSANVTMTRCVNKAAVTGKCPAVFAIGGFIGNVNAGTVQFQDCVNEGVVSSTQAPTSECIGSFVGAIDEGSKTSVHVCKVIDLGGNIDTANSSLPMVGAIKPLTQPTTSVTGFFQPAAGGVTVAAPTAGEYKVLTLTNMTALAITGDLTLTSAAGFAGEVTSADDTKKVEVDDQGTTKVYTLVNKSTPIDPTKPSDPVEVTDGQDAADAAAAKWVADNGVAPADNDVAALLDTDEKKKAYSDLFTGKATNVGGNSYVFSVVLAPATVTTVQPVANKAAADVVDAFASETPAVTVNTIPGLYYGVGEAATVGADKVVGTWVLGDGSAKTLSFTKQGDARFYQVKVQISK